MTSPRLLACGFGSFPAAPLNPSAAVVEAIAREGWSPPGVRLSCLTLPVAWSRSAETVLDHVAGERFDGVLVVGVAVEADAFRVETLGRNRADPARPDHDGALWPAAAINDKGPEAFDATAPTEAMLAALQAAALPAGLSDDAGDYLCNFTLFRLLAARAARAVGFLHVPQARECDPAAAFALAEIDRGVRVSLAAFAAGLRGRGA